MVYARIFLLLVLVILVLPVFSILALSFQGINHQPLIWYITILHDQGFLDASILSIIIGMITAILVTILSFYLSLSWYDSRQKLLVLITLLLLGLLPPDIIALSLLKAAQFCGLYTSSLSLLVIGLTLYMLPLGILLFWTNFYFISPSIIVASKDLGMGQNQIVLKILLPLSKSTIFSCLIFVFLLCFNEYSRTYYLSGSYLLLSEYLNGKLNSGASSSIYAGGSLSIFATLCLIVIYSITYFSKGTKQNI